MSFDSKTHTWKHKEYTTYFTESGETERGRTCPACKVYKSPQGFRCKKGTRFGKQGRIRNAKCIECESGLRDPKKKVEDYHGEIDELRERLEKMEDYNGEMRETYNKNLELYDSILSALLETYDLRLSDVVKDVEEGKKITLKKR